MTKPVADVSRKAEAIRQALARAPLLGFNSRGAAGDDAATVLAKPAFVGSLILPGAPAAIVSPAGPVSATQRLANDRQGLMVTNGILAGMVLGRNEQVNCSDCITGFGSAGSFSFGLHGRKQITQDLSVVGGAAFAEYRNGGVNVTSSPILAGLFRYDLTELGTARPYAEVGGVGSPGQHVISTRLYNGGAGQGSSSATSATVFGRLGYLDRFTPRDEAAAFVELAHGWQRFGGYSEGALPSNPFPLATPGGTDQLNAVRVGAQWTRLWGDRIETQINLAVARSFGSSSGLNAIVSGVGIPVRLSEYTWGEYGARIGYRLSKNVIVAAFADGTLGDRPINTTIHGGIAVRYSY